MTYLPDRVIDRLRSLVDTPDFSGTRYRLVEEIGRGGMGVVYKAEDTALGRMVALKVVEEEAAGAEARIMAALEHPGIVPVHDAGMLPDGRVYYAMKLIEGASADALRGSLPDRLRVFEKVCDAVAFAHSRGVVHGDLKPANILIGPFGEALVMDWGVAAVARTGALAGTRGYMAPERTLSPRADIYALGAMLREWSGEHFRPPLASICARAMAERPEDRYETALDLRADVTHFLDGEPVTAHRETIAERAARLLRKHQLWIVLVAAYLLMRVTLLIVLGR